MINNLSWFLHNLFGLEMNSNEINDLIETHPDRDMLIAVAMRIKFVDQLRYRSAFEQGSFSPGFSPGELTYRLNNESLALQQHLLLTCIDALSEKDFITFPDWLGVQKSPKKTKYHINDNNISNTLNQHIDLKTPDSFRFAAKKVYSQNYLPSHGIKNSINQFFLSLPDELKVVLSNAYVISDLFDDLFELQIDNNGNPTNLTLWGKELNKWKTLSTENKLLKISDYFYRILRNPYTHKAITPRQKNQFIIKDHHDTKGKESFDYINDVYDDKNRQRIIRFKGLSIEDEFLIIRLLVVIGWLSRAGHQIQQGFVEKFRSFQIRREFIFLSLRELEFVSLQLDYYQNKTYKELSRFNAGWSLPKLRTYASIRLRKYLRTNTNYEGGLDSMIETYLHKLKNINDKVVKQNDKYIPKDSYFPTDKERTELSKNMPKAFNIIQKEVNQAQIERNIEDIYRILDDLSERMI